MDNFLDYMATGYSCAAEIYGYMDVFFFIMALFWTIFRLKNSLKIVFLISCMHLLKSMLDFFTQHA